MRKGEAHRYLRDLRVEHMLQKKPVEVRMHNWDKTPRHWRALQGKRLLGIA